ncbi:MAG: alpha/beta hydrolase [Bacilli bacterium]|nr:alpha/beta hydrolase [Bacilli bacterium]
MVLTSLPTWAFWLIIGVSIFIGVSLLFGLWIIFETARRVYLHTLSKKYGGGWGRTCSAPNNPEQVKMWDEGVNYMAQFADKKQDVQIENDGLKLAGEFYDFGHKKTALFLAGRCECLMYGYYYAKPYKESGYNLLFIDPRAHGFSEGKLSTVGIKESTDVLAWMKYIAKEFNQESFALHCVCVGGAAGLLAATSKDNPGLVERITLDGAFINFKESYRRHYVDLGHKIFPVFHLIWMWFRIYTGVSVMESNPEECVKKLTIPVLFIHSKNDKYSVPENAEILFNECISEKKKLVWFTEGTHSHIRNNATEKYDQTVKEFLTVK